MDRVYVKTPKAGKYRRFNIEYTPRIVRAKR